MSRPERPPLPMARRWSIFPRTVMLRLARSWTLWRQRRADKRLVREARRLESLELLVEYQQYRVRRAEARAHPLQAVPTPLSDELEREMARPPSQQMLLTEGRPEPMPEPEDLEPMPDPAEEIAQRVGLPPRRT